MTTLDLISNLCAAAREDGAKDDDPVQLKLADLEEICRLAGYTDPYMQLLYAVSSKHEGESRHATALRYILERESRISDPADALTVPAVKLETVFNTDHNLVRPDCYKP